MDIFALTMLAQEYQVNWLLEKINIYLNEFSIGKNTPVKKLLPYVQLGSDMGWKDVERRFLNICRIESFIELQTYSEFSCLEIRLQILLVRLRLWCLMDTENATTEFKNLRKKLLNEEHTGMLYILEKCDQESFVLNFY